jgi:hypothetical protein
MKITVVNKAIVTKKPSNFCPWIMDDNGPRT